MWQPALPVSSSCPDSERGWLDRFQSQSLTMNSWQLEDPRDSSLRLARRLAENYWAELSAAGLKVVPDELALCVRRLSLQRVNLGLGQKPKRLAWLE